MDQLEPTPSHINRLGLVVGGLLILIIGLLGGYLLASRSTPAVVTPALPLATASPYPTLSTVSLSEIQKEVTTTPLKPIAIQSTKDWKQVTFNGVSFKIPPDLTFQPPDIGSNWGIIIKEGEIGSPRTHIVVQNYQGGSRRQEYYGDQYFDCHAIYEEAMFDNVKALQIAIDTGWCQGGGGAIVTVIGTKLVMVGNLWYDLATKQINRDPLNDAIVSTLVVAK